MKLNSALPYLFSWIVFWWCGNSHYNHVNGSYSNDVLNVFVENKDFYPLLMSESDFPEYENLLWSVNVDSMQRQLESVNDTSFVAAVGNDILVYWAKYDLSDTLSLHTYPRRTQYWRATYLILNDKAYPIDDLVLPKSDKSKVIFTTTKWEIELPDRLAKKFICYINATPVEWKITCHQFAYFLTSDHTLDESKTVRINIVSSWIHNPQIGDLYSLFDQKMMNDEDEPLMESEESLYSLVHTSIYLREDENELYFLCKLWQRGLAIMTLKQMYEQYGNRGKFLYKMKPVF